jgi:hypothetical protein
MFKNIALLRESNPKKKIQKNNLNEHVTRHDTTATIPPSKPTIERTAAAKSKVHTGNHDAHPPTSRCTSASRGVLVIRMAGLGVERLDSETSILISSSFNFTDAGAQVAMTQKHEQVCIE